MFVVFVKSRKVLWFSYAAVPPKLRRFEFQFPSFGHMLAPLKSGLVTYMKSYLLPVYFVFACCVVRTFICVCFVDCLIVCLLVCLFACLVCVCVFDCLAVC